MTETDKPIGQLFSHVYLERGSPMQDDELFRSRLGGYVQNEFFKDHAKLNAFIKKETGLKVKITPLQHGAYNHFEEFFASAPLEKLLNIITLTWRFQWANNAETKIVNGKLANICEKAEQWHKFVSRVFVEENIGYTLDEKCGVHFLVDEEYERNRMSLLACLNVERYSGIKDSFEKAHRYLESEPNDTKASLRALFEAVEILVKLMVETKNLNKWVIENPVKEIILEHYKDDPTACSSASLACEGFAKWVDGMHFYRHGQGSIEPVAPPMSFVIYALSSGTSFLRWLVTIDAEILQSN